MKSFRSPVRTLMGPGPSDVPPRVLQALAHPTIGHLDPAFLGMMDAIRDLLRYAFQTRNEVTLAVSGSGTVGMETCIVNLVEPGDKVVVCRNGYFGNRMVEMVERCGGEPVIVDIPWGRAVDPNQLEDTLRAHPDAKIVAFVHAETSTGVLSDAQTLAEIAHRSGCLVLMDAVTSLGGYPVQVDAWGLDAVYSASQKCLSCVPGLAPVTFSPRAMETIRRRKTRVRSWFLDITMLLAYWQGENRRAYHHTAPINSLYALHEALVILREEGLENAWTRHKSLGRRLGEGLEAMGLAHLPPEGERIPHLRAVRVPPSVDEAAVRNRLLEEFNLEIGAGLGPLAGQIWRFGLMGYSCNAKNVVFCLGALKAVLASDK